MNGQAERPEAHDDAIEQTEQDTETPLLDSSAAGDEPEVALEAARAEAAENWERYLRAAAELENVRKRAMRDVEHARKYALENFSRDLLAWCQTLRDAVGQPAGPLVW